VSTVALRPETPADAPGVRRVNEEAFGQPDEAEIVDRLRARAEGYLALVAVEGNEVVGHIAFSRVTLDPPRPELSLLGLAPMAVLPDRQGEGVGSALVREGLAACREAGADAVFVLGHPGYYPRFGFTPAAQHGIRDEYGAPPEAFLVLELRPGALEGVRGTARYDPALAG
jgi:putative acetyltransferase